MSIDLLQELQMIFAAGWVLFLVLIMFVIQSLDIDPYTK